MLVEFVMPLFGRFRAHRSPHHTQIRGGKASCGTAAMPLWAAPQPKEAARSALAGVGCAITFLAADGAPRDILAVGNPFPADLGNEGVGTGLGLANAGA